MGVKDLQKELGQRIRRLRIQNGYTQESFADKCGLHRNFMGAVERGEQNLTLKSLHMIATGLRTNMAKLLSGLE
jgi:transcriptional regulator with XRE-family HTH domain